MNKMLENFETFKCLNFPIYMYTLHSFGIDSFNYISTDICQDSPDQIFELK